ncbi:MAG: hypothetical protein DWQ37_17425 [Planctomycetota bacterium]|nr:MAG: hypothetical protein DWQ37_17425 [Planctomycetota bacterium]
MPKRISLVAAIAVVSLVNASFAADLTDGMKKGTPDLKSAGPLTFAPQGILLVGDPQAAAVFAIATEDTSAGSPSQPLKIEKIDGKVASLLGTTPQGMLINDMAVNPETGSTFLSVSRGTGPDAEPVLVRVDSAGKVGEFSLEGVRFSKAAIPNPATDGRSAREVTTDLQFTDGKVIVAGLSNEEFASNLRVLSFPFAEADQGTSVEIFHGAHGKVETRSPVRTFAVFDVAGKPNVLAAYTCTPLVRFPLSDLQPGKKVRGTTVAELGNRNRPLDMVVYQKDGKDYLLIANNSRGVMKVDVAKIDETDGITDRVSGGGTAGLPYDTIKELQGVTQLDKLDKEHALVLVQTDSGMNLEAVELP